MIIARWKPIEFLELSGCLVFNRLEFHCSMISSSGSLEKVEHILVRLLNIWTWIECFWVLKLKKSHAIGLVILSSVIQTLKLSCIYALFWPQSQHGLWFFLIFFSCQFTFLILIWTFISGIWTFLSFLYLSFMSPDIFEFSCPLFIWTYLSMDSSRNLWLLLFRILITSPYYFLCYWFIFLVSYIFYCILFCSFHSFFFQSKFFQVFYMILTKSGESQSELIYQVIWPDL